MPSEGSKLRVPESVKTRVHSLNTLQAQGSGTFKLSQQGDDPADKKVMRSGDDFEAGSTGVLEGTEAARQRKAAAGAEETFSQGLSPQDDVSGGQAEDTSQAAAAEKLSFYQGSHHSVAMGQGQHQAASNWSIVPTPGAGAAEGLQEGSQQLTGSQEAGQAPHVTPAEGMAASLVEHSHAAPGQSSHLYPSRPSSHMATTADTAERAETSAMTQHLRQKSGKAAAEQHELPAVNELPPWFKESSEDAEEVRGSTHPLHIGLQL